MRKASAKHMCELFAMQQMSTECAVQAVNALLHLHPDDLSQLLGVIYNCLTSHSVYEENNSDFNNDSDGVC